MAGEQLSKPQLKELARRVIVAQGNEFIKELLRGAGGKIGTTKEAFAANLAAAIDDDLITQAMFEAWLKEIEGWGDQHLYLVEPPQCDAAALADAIAAGPHAACRDAAASLDFPATLELKHISLDAEGLSLAWHQGKEGWNRWRPKDTVETEGLEFYRFEAYRRRFDRSIARFEWRFADPYAAILIHRNTEIDHGAVFAQVRDVLADIGCGDAPFARIPLSRAVKQASRRHSAVHSTRFETEGGFVEVASTLPEGGIESVEPVRLVLHAVDPDRFERAQGMLHFVAEDHGVSRKIAVQIYGEEARLRIWAQCRREDIFQILGILWGHNSAA
jgi:hypothetical protein